MVENLTFSSSTMKISENVENFSTFSNVTPAGLKNSAKVEKSIFLYITYCILTILLIL